MGENVADKRIYAGVRLFDVPLYLDRTYTYYVPPEWEDIAKAGAVVSVPFGGGNRKMAGIVTGVSDTFEGDYEVKPLDGVSGGGPALTAEMMGLCRFLVSHTLCTFGEAVHTVAPPKALSRLAESYAATEKSPAKGKLSEKALAVLQYIRSHGETSSAKLRAEFGADAGDLMAVLLRNKYIERRVKIEEQTGIKYETHVSLAPDADTDGAKLRSLLQTEIVEILKKSGRISEEELSLRLGKSVKPQLSSLEKKGLVILEKTETYRNPYITECVPKTDTATLSPEQKKAYDAAVALYNENEPKAMLLHGVTGSGKTRVIKAMIDKTVEDGKGVIVLVPEIALTPQTVSFFCGCYGERVSVIHSALSQGERYDAWRRIRDGKSDIVIGTRSAIFAPLKSIGMIVIDEEQEHTYKSDTDPKYLAHEVASYRCKVHNAFMMLSSATPSFTSYYKAKSGVYTLVALKERYGDAKLPAVVIDDMRKNMTEGALYVGKKLAEELVSVKEDGKQAIVFLNRRGYSSSVICRVCGESLQCPSCSVALTYHIHSPLGNAEDPEEYQRMRAKCGELTCHYCGYRMRIPDKCPACNSMHFRYIGCGTQQAEEEIKKAAPGVEVIRMDYDTTKRKGAHKTLLTDFRNKKAEVLLGTQMVTKGHDFPDVRLVGVMNADSGLMLDDYRAAEKTFSMLTQVIGRAGRADGNGLAIIQSLNPQSEVLRFAAAQDYEGFYENEIKLRRALNFPPFCDIITLTLSGTDESLLSASAVRLNEYLQSIMKDRFSDVPLTAYGPFEAPVYKVQNVCRMRMVFKCKLTRRVRELVADILCEFGQKNAKKITISADINPSGL